MLDAPGTENCAVCMGFSFWGNDRRGAVRGGRIQNRRNDRCWLASLNFQGQMPAGLLVLFSANFTCLNVSLDTIPSVLGEYKPLPVVRCVKNKYLLSRPLFADLGSKKFKL